MGYYEEGPPRHGHRIPSELAEDEILAAVHGDYCGMPATFDDAGPTTDTESTRSTKVALVPWADAHPDNSNALRPPKTPLKGQE